MSPFRGLFFCSLPTHRLVLYRLNQLVIDNIYSKLENTGAKESHLCRAPAHEAGVLISQYSATVL